MATIKQRKAFKEITENHRSVSGAMKEVGYAESSVTKPSNLTASKGFKELCDEYGLTDEFLTSALVEDIKAKPQNRKPELELGFKIKGRLEEKQPTNNFVVIPIYGGLSFQGHASDTKDISVKEEN